MRKSIGTAATVLVLGTAASGILGGTALASTGSSGGIGGSPANAWITMAANNCAGNSYTIKNGKIVKVAPNCTSSNTSSNGSSGGSQGTSSQGTQSNNCAGSSTKVVNGVVTTSNGCTASAKGTGGNSH